jgi:hypothetical protein
METGRLGQAKAKRTRTGFTGVDVKSRTKSRTGFNRTRYGR